MESETRLDDIENLAKLKTTLVFFMGLMKLRGLVDRLIKHYPADTPTAAVYKAGRRKEEKIIQGTLKDITPTLNLKGIFNQLYFLHLSISQTNRHYIKAAVYSP